MMIMLNQDAADTATSLTEWNALSVQTRRREWARYTAAIDAGDAGWTRYATLLIHAWCEGFDPTYGLVTGQEFGAIAAIRPAPA